MDIAYETNLTCALTDLLMGGILIPMLPVLLFLPTGRKKEKKQWLCFFSLLALSCLLGYYTHNNLREGVRFTRMWILLYALLFASAAVFFLLSRYLSSDGKAPDSREKKRFLLLSGLVYVGTAAYEQFVGSAIRAFAVYALIFGLWGFVSVGLHGIRRHIPSEVLLAASVFPLLPAAFFQIRRDALVRIVFYFDHNGLSHLFITVSLLLLFLSALLRLTRSSAGETK